MVIRPKIKKSIYSSSGGQYLAKCYGERQADLPLGEITGIVQDSISDHAPDDAGRCIAGEPE